MNVINLWVFWGCTLICFVAEMRWVYQWVRFEELPQVFSVMVIFILPCLGISAGVGFVVYALVRALRCLFWGQGEKTERLFSSKVGVERLALAFLIGSLGSTTFCLREEQFLVQHIHNVVPIPLVWAAICLFLGISCYWALLKWIGRT